MVLGASICRSIHAGQAARVGGGGHAACRESSSQQCGSHAYGQLASTQTVETIQIAEEHSQYKIQSLATCQGSTQPDRVAHHRQAPAAMPPDEAGQLYATKGA